MLPPGSVGRRGSVEQHTAKRGKLYRKIGH
jgi:hypothetical protein